MIRAKELIEEYGNMLENEVVVDENPADEELLPPLDKIKPSLYNANQEVHKLQRELLQRDFSIEEIKKAHGTLAPAEKAVEVLIATGSKLPVYLRIAAKVIDAGDKLDNLLLKEIIKHENRFNEDYSKIVRWRPEYGFDSIAKTRKELDEATREFFELEKIYNERSLPEKDIKSARAVFSDYKSKMELMRSIDAEISAIIKDYQGISSPKHLKDFKEATKTKTVGSLLSKGELLKKCENAEYKEAAADIKAIVEEMNYVLKDFSRIESIRTRIIENTNRVRIIYKEVQDIEKQGLSSDNFQRFKSIEDKIKAEINSKELAENNLIYLEGVISEYKKAANELLNKIKVLYSSIVSTNAYEKKKQTENKKKESPPKKVPWEINLNIDKKRRALYIQAVGDETIKKGSVDESPYFSFNYGVDKLNDIAIVNTSKGIIQNEIYTQLRDTIKKDNYAITIEDIKTLSKKVKDLSDLSSNNQYVDENNLDYIKGLYYCVRESFRRGIFISLRKKENEKVIEELLDNFEKYIFASQNLRKTTQEVIS